MKLPTIRKGISYSVFLFVLTSSAGYAGVMKSTDDNHDSTPGKFYMGVFGGYGSARQFHVSQFGTAFYTEEVGGPLAVNAFGTTNNRSGWFIGAHVGYQVPEIVINPISQVAIVPAAELEGFYLGNHTFTGSLSNNTARLPEHDFEVRYPKRTGVFLTNAVLSFNIPCACWFHPYIGAGIGGAVISISGADATQISPPEPGINHYNSNSNDTASTFAGQIKLGLNFDLTKCTSMFVEYRWLYLSSTHYAFGSTVYPGHPATSYWQVKLNPQYYNMAAIGFQYSL